MTRYRWLLLALFLFALGVRLFRLDWDQYHFYHPDERAVASAVNNLSFSPLQLNPKWFNYGTLPFYVTKTVTSVLSTARGWMGNPDRWYSGYDGSIITARALSAVWGAAAILLVGILGARLYGQRVALLAAFLLAAAVSHVQNSHFATNDIPLTTLVLAALYFLVRVVEEGRPRHYLLAGFLIGMAAATKFSAMPLLLPLGVAGLVRWWREGSILRPFACLTGAAVAAGAGFFVAQPYAIIDFQRYVDAISEQSRMVRNAGEFPYTNQYIGVPKYLYELQEMVLWGMGPLLGLAALWGFLRRFGQVTRANGGAEIVLLSWVVPFFLINGWFDVKFPRYLLPIFPILVLWAAVWLDDIARRGRLGRVVRGTVVAGTALYLLAFLSIYTRPHSIVTASEWVHSHIPAGATILTQHWDEGFPFSLPGGRRAERYKIVDLPYYEPDNPQKFQKISEQLASADYVALQTKRLYGAVTRAPEKYPLTTKYFSLLFEGKLGYQLIRDISSRPGLLGLELPTELADESFSVYDHPKALLFQNVERLPAEEIHDRIMRGVPTLTRRDLLLASAEGGGELAAGEVDPWIRSSFAATILCALFLQVLGLAAYFLLRPVLTPRHGLYGFSKVIGLLLAVYPPWLAASVGWVGFSQASVLVSATAVVLFGAWSYRRHRDMEIPRTEVIATEILFWGCFLFQLGVRAFNPEIFWGEKPMDFSFLNALYRASAMPPPEPWFAGSPLHYTYFGTYVVAAIGKALSIHPAVMFNLGVVVTAALTASAVFAAGTALARRWSVGVVAACLATLTGNLAGVREAISRGQFNFDYFWATSRVIEGTINEYPLWSFLFADLHAHMLVMPYTMSFVCALVFWIQRRDKISAWVPLSAAPVLLLLLGLLLGTVMVTNGWSTPTYVLLVPFLLFISFVTTHEGEGIVSYVLSGIGRVLLPAFTAVGLAYLFYLPFWLWFAPPTRSFGWENDSFARPYDYLTIHGLFIALLLPFLFVLWRRSLATPAGAPDAAGAPRPSRISRWRLAALSLVIAGLLLSLLNLDALATLEFPASARDWQARSIRAFAALCGVLGLFVAVLPRTPTLYRYALGLGAYAFFVTGGVDVVHVWDRMNTVFKFYLESWLLFSLASAVVLVELFRGALGGAIGRNLWRAVIAGLALITVFTAATGVHGVLTTRRVPTVRPTLDGSAYLQQHMPHDAAAFEWLSRTVKGIPVLVEAQGPSYQEFSRVTMNTGLPTVLGWDYHVTQRSQPDRDIRRRKADITTIYSSKNESEVAAALERYHAALVYVGPLERRTYKGGNLEKFQEWNSLLSPVYQNPGVTIFAVTGRFGGSVPVTTIEEVAAVAPGEEIHEQDVPGRLNQPRGLALDAEGNVYVADFANNRIQRFGPELQAQEAWGKRGDLPGEFKDPCGVAVGPDGLIYVADTWNGRVQVFDEEGAYRLEWAPGFYGPRGIAVAADGRVFVADTGNHRVSRFSADGTKEAQWGAKGGEPGQYFEPTGIAVDAEGRVYVADNGNGRLQITDRDGGFIRAFDVPGWRSEVFSEPYVTIDSDGVLWVTVPVERQIRAYDTEGKLLATIHGGKDEPFDRPMGIGIHPVTGNLVVTDLEHRLVQVPKPPVR
jgi:YYY domain-containing protein